MKTLTTTTATPIRITADHYQIESLSKQRAGKVYDLHFNYEQKRWQCSCKDAQPREQAGNANPNCKHVRRLREWINEQTTKRVQAEATAIVAEAQEQPTDAHVQALMLREQAEMIQYLESKIGKLEQLLHSRIDAQDAEIAQVRAELAKKANKRGLSQEHRQSIKRIARESTTVERREVAEELKRERAAERLAAHEERLNAPINASSPRFSLLK